LFTSFYSFRLVFLAFVNNSNSFKMYIEDVHDAPIKMVLPLIFLGFGSIFWGFLSRDLFIGLGTSFFSASIFIFPDNLLLIDSEFSMVILKNIPFIFTLFGICLSFLLINCSITSKDMIFSYKMSNSLRPVFIFLIKKWHLDQINNNLVAVKSMNFGYRTSFQIADKGSIEFFGPFGFSFNFLNITKHIVFLQSGYVFHYSFMMLLSIVFMFSFLFFAFNFAFINILMMFSITVLYVCIIFQIND
jgi:NADH-ubiquinone oxidoreductase chain 5